MQRPRLRIPKIKRLDGWWNKKSPAPINFPARYTGQWTFVDSTNKKQHTFSIAPSLHLFIDRREIEGHIVKIDQNELLFLDKYGYRVKVTAGLNGPTTVYDEADDVTYKLEAVSSR